MTLVELYKRALIEMQVLAAGEDADPDDAALLADKYVGLYDQLAFEGLATWAFTDDIPDYASGPVSMMLACASATAFGLLGPIKAMLIREGGLNNGPDQGGVSTAEKHLRRAAARSYVSHPAQSEYF